MKFTASTGGDGASYERPKPGNYIGILISVANIGTQDHKEYGPKRKIALRWELHKSKGPSIDSQGHIHTIRALYNQSFDAKAKLRGVIEAHLGSIVDGSDYDSANWLGTGAHLFLKATEDLKYVNVEIVMPLDPKDDDIPAQHEPSTHWEGPEDGPPPSWARDMIEKSEEWTSGEWNNGNGQSRTTAVAQTQEEDEEEEDRQLAEEDARNLM